MSTDSSSNNHRRKANDVSEDSGERRQTEESSVSRRSFLQGLVSMGAVFSITRSQAHAGVVDPTGSCAGIANVTPKYYWADNACNANGGDKDCGLASSAPDGGGTPRWLDADCAHGMTGPVVDGRDNDCGQVYNGYAAKDSDCGLNQDIHGPLIGVATDNQCLPNVSGATDEDCGRLAGPGFIHNDGDDGVSEGQPH